MAKVIREYLIVFFTTLLTRWLEDIFIFTGIILLIINTYLITVIEINILAGNYLLSLVLILLGVIVAKKERG